MAGGATLVKKEQATAMQKNRFWAAGVIAAVLVAALPLSRVAAQGYHGLIPDNQQKPAPKAAPEEPGYHGLISPNRRTDAPKGYEGVVPGFVPERETGIIDATPPSAAAAPQSTPVPKQAAIPPKYTPAPDAPKRVVAMTPAPGSRPLPTIRSAQDLEDFARMQGFELKLPKLTEEMAARIKTSPKTYSLTSSPGMRINGMLPQEAMIKKQIEQVMFSINMKGLTPEQRRRNARAGYEKLKMFADSFMYKKSIPDEVYVAMGAPSIFVKEQRESTDKALERLREAFKTLQPLQ